MTKKHDGHNELRHDLAVEDGLEPFTILPAWSTVKDALTYAREKHPEWVSVVERYYGVDMDVRLSMSALAKERNVSRSRISQLCDNVLQIMRDHIRGEWISVRNGKIQAREGSLCFAKRVYAEKSLKWRFNDDKEIKLLKADFAALLRLENVSTHTIHGLLSDDIMTDEALALRSRNELLRIPNIGKVGVAEIETYLSKRMLKLSDAS